MQPIFVDAKSCPSLEDIDDVLRRMADVMLIGEYLSDMARELCDRRVVLVEAGPDQDTALAVVKLALVLERHPRVGPAEDH